MKELSCLLVLLAFAACAFKPSEQDDPASNVPAPVSAPPIPWVASIALMKAVGSAESGPEKVTASRSVEGNSSSTQVIKTPFIIKEGSKDSLPLRLTLSDSFAQSIDSIAGSWSPDLEGHFPIAVDLVPVGSSGPAWTMRAPIPPGWFSREAEVTGYLHLRGKAGDGQVLGHLVVPFTTPPSKVRLKADLIHGFDSGESVPQDWKQLRGFGIRADLVAVTTVTNESWFPVGVVNPTEVGGEITTRFHDVKVKRRLCGYDLEETDRSESLADRLFLLPLDEGIATHFRDWLEQGAVEKGLRRTIAPMHSQRWGLFALGSKVADWIDGKYPRPQLTPAEVISGCKARCVVSSNQAATFWNYWSSQGWPGASKTCWYTNCGGTFPSYDEAACSACYEWDEGMGLPYDNDHRRCMGYLPGNPWGGPTRNPWEVTKTTGTVQAGIQSSAIILKVDGAASKTTVWFDTGDAETEEAKRVLDGMLPTEVRLAE